MIKTRTDLATFMISPQNSDTLTITHFKGDQKLHDEVISAKKITCKRSIIWKQNKHHQKYAIRKIKAIKLYHTSY